MIADGSALSGALDDLSTHAREALGVSGSGVLVASGGQQRAVLGASDSRMHRLEQLQTTFDEGPCMDAYHNMAFVGAPDLATHDVRRWPSFGPAVVAAGVGAAFSFPLTVGDIALGALDCYRVQPGALTPAQISNGYLFADIAADLIMHAQMGTGVDAVVDHMVRSNSAHDRIEQARGIVAYQTGDSMERALGRMREHAREHELSLDAVAQQIVQQRLRLDA